MKLAIHWFRRDLRLNDNTALFHAVNEAEVVIPVFVLEEALRTGPDVGAARLNGYSDRTSSMNSNGPNAWPCTRKL